MKKIINLITIATSILLPNLVQAQATSPMEVSATVVPGCFISADNINFGTLSMPLNDTTAEQLMMVHCSKGANLEIAIDYDNVDYGGSGSKFTYTIESEDYYRFYIKLYQNGKPLTSNKIDVACRTNDGVWFGSLDIAEMYGYSKATTYLGTSPLCNTTNTNGIMNLDLVLSGGTSQVGVLNGINRGETIKYYLSLPSSTSIWNNNNKYLLKGTGLEQNIPMKANIKRADNPTHLMTSDTYQDTLTVVLTY